VVDPGRHAAFINRNRNDPARIKKFNQAVNKRIVSNLSLKDKRDKLFDYLRLEMEIQELQLQSLTFAGKET
jgi:hypothetical protein